VPWEEINAAWGQSVLLLAVLMRRGKFTSRKYELYPCGSFSSIAETKPSSIRYELYGTEANFARLTYYFNKGQECFLDCVHEFSQYVQAQSSFVLPYRIEPGRIGDFSIRYALNAKESWTRALRYMLQTLKALMYSHNS
jgi:beclin 1